MLSRSSKSHEPPEMPAANSRAGHPTIASIAAQMGLSRATVTHVLNGRGTEQRIRPETQERVLAVANELGYRPNASARAVRAGRFGSIALLQSRLGQYLPTELVAGVTGALAAERLHLVLTEVANVDAGGEACVADAMRELSVDGVLVNRHGGKPPAFLERIQQLRIPAIFLNSRQEHDCIHPDDLLGGRLAAEYLLGLGHRRIAYVGTQPFYIPHYSEADRRQGYEHALAAAGLTPRVHLLPFDWRAPEADGDQRVRAVIELLQGADRPTAVVAYELREALAVVRAADQLGLRIPADLSLVQFHHGLEFDYFVPVHTVCNAMREVGEGAVKLLLEKIEHPERALPAQVVPETLLEGATCAPPRDRVGAG